ncbi:hypothetical protein ASF73_16510 [Xanthomonas sp. Leaf131]|nr:hypothetical protein ASF73_16510 [Xanthomonas sp. Leaf131]
MTLTFERCLRTRAMTLLPARALATNEVIEGMKPCLHRDPHLAPLPQGEGDASNIAALWLRVTAGAGVQMLLYYQIILLPATDVSARCRSCDKGPSCRYLHGMDQCLNGLPGLC